MDFLLTDNEAYQLLEFRDTGLPSNIRQQMILTRHAKRLAYWCNFLTRLLLSLGEHISRFAPPNGKYVPLAVKDYALVDFRRNATGQPSDISRHPNRISVFFKKDDSSVARCIFGQDTTVVEI